MIGVGIDFGTSNSAVAWFDGSRVRLVSIEQEKKFLPTAIHLDREYRSRTGASAIQQYVEENRARRVEITAKPIGEAAFDVREVLGDESDKGAGEQKRALYGPKDDHGLPGRLFLGVKRLLGQEEIERVSVFQRSFRVVALITPILLSLRKGVQLSTRASTMSFSIGRPVRFEGRKDNSNAIAISRMGEASLHAGLDPAHFYPEPVAACLSFIHQRKIARKCTVLTVDFGGGTLDLSLVRWDGSHFAVLDTDGAAVGGDHIDQKIYRELVFSELGKGITWTRKVDGRQVTTPFPFHLYENALLNWAVTHTLNQNEYTARLAEYIEQGGPDSGKIARLRDLIIHNDSYNVLEEIKAAKARLSETEYTTLDIPELNLSKSFSRAELNRIAADAIAILRERIGALLERNGIARDSVDFVVRTGGSSKMVSVVQLLDDLFPGKVAEHDPFTSVASGLAIASYYGYRYNLDD